MRRVLVAVPAGARRPVLEQAVTAVDHENRRPAVADRRRRVLAVTCCDEVERGRGRSDRVAVDRRETVTLPPPETLEGRSPMLYILRSGESAYCNDRPFDRRGKVAQRRQMLQCGNPRSCRPYNA